MISWIFSIAERVFDRIVPFLAVLFLVVFITYGFLVLIDFIPEAPVEETVVSEETASEEIVVDQAEDATPDRLIIDSLGKEVDVLNPRSSDVAVLDNALLSGVVRHPESADLLSDGAMLLFGHSSYLPNVFNKNFQAFNGIQDLEWGDKIRVQSSDFEYVYRVDRVYEVSATAAEIEVDTTLQKLTLVTCNTFGEKEDRFVVEATLVDSYRI